MDISKPEANGPFLIYEVPNFVGADNTTEYSGFYILLWIDGRYAEIDLQTTWYSGKVVSATQVLFQMPAWPYCMYPFGPHSRLIYDSIVNQVDDQVKKSINAAHTSFDQGDGAQTAVQETRKWKYYLLDFSNVKGIGELSSKVLYEDAGEQEALDYDLLSAPADWSVDKQGNYAINREEELLGFKVANVDNRGGRKVARSAAKKSKLAEKREEAQRRRAAAQQQNMQQG